MGQAHAIVGDVVLRPSQSPTPVSHIGSASFIMNARCPSSSADLPIGADEFAIGDLPFAVDGHDGVQQFAQGQFRLAAQHKIERGELFQRFARHRCDVRAKRHRDRAQAARQERAVHIVGQASAR